MPRSIHHVGHNPNGGCDVKPGGGQRFSGHFETKTTGCGCGTENQPEPKDRVRDPRTERTASIGR